MRADTATFASFNEAPNKEPRFVVQLIYGVSSPSFTSHAGISNVPGVQVDSTIVSISGTSQRLTPEEGRTTIGNIAVVLTDGNSPDKFTNEIRDQLNNNNEGLRGLEVRIWVGYTDDFDDYARIATPVVANVQRQRDGSYKLDCADITRELRTNIFEPKSARLAASLTADATEIDLDTTAGFQTVYHGNSYSDAPGQTVGYVKVQQTGEIIRYTGVTDSPPQLTGCTRGAFSTTAKPVEFDANTAADRRPEIKEFIYLEMPGPMLALAVMTGDIPGSSPAATLPAHWHLGISATWIRESDFENIGTDLWDTTDDQKGLPVRFTELKRTDGKKFLETEVYQLLGCYTPIYADGNIGLKRLTKVLADAPHDIRLTASNVVRAGSLKHNLQKVINQIRIDWNWQGEKFTRTNLFIDSASVTTHGAAKLKTLQFKGLHGARHTVTTLSQRTQSLRDRHGNPPLELEVDVLPSLNKVEVGDIVRVTLPTLQDFAGTDTLDRSFEVQGTNINWRTGQVRLQLFGSSADPDTSAPDGENAAAPLSDCWYTKEGTELSTVLTISGGAVTASGTLNGNADLNAAGAIFYYDGDLTINAGVVVTITENVQLRIKGFLTINGSIDGQGGGQNGVSDTRTKDVTGQPDLPGGTPGFLGTTRGSDGYLRTDIGKTRMYNAVGKLTKGAHNSFPHLHLISTQDGGSPGCTAALDGLPTDLRGTGGGPGGAISLDSGAGPVIKARGGAGGDGGAGLAIISRGLGTGVSADIDLSGDNGAAGETAAAAWGDLVPRTV